MNNEQTPLWKQLAGAGVGAMVALALYFGFKVSAPAITGMLVLPQERIGSDSIGEVRIAATNISERDSQRIINRAQEIATKLSKNAPKPVEHKAASKAFVAQTETPLIAEPLQELQPVEAPASVQATDTKVEPVKVVAAKQVIATGKTDLPESGVGLWMAILVAFVVPTATLWKRKFMAVQSAQS